MFVIYGSWKGSFNLWFRNYAMNDKDQSRSLSIYLDEKFWREKTAWVLE